MAKQTWKGYRVNSLPTTGDTRIKQANRFYLNVGGGKFKTYIVNNLLQLTTEAGAEFIECDTMEQMRALDARQIWAIENGYYKGVKLNGYYAKGDTPSPIEYYLSETADLDDGGSVIVVGDIKLEHDFTGYVLDDKYFGYKLGVVFSIEENFIKLSKIYNSQAIRIVHTKDYVVDVDRTLVFWNEGCYIEANNFTIKQKDFSGMIVSRIPIFQVRSNNVVIDGLILDDNIANNYIDKSGYRIYALVPGAVPEIPAGEFYGHSVFGINGNNVTVRNCKILGASWAGLSVGPWGAESQIENIIIEHNYIEQTFRDSISVHSVKNCVVRHNECYNGVHHLIHNYRNNINTVIEYNTCYNNLESLQEWWTGMNALNMARTAIVVDHSDYADKTVNTTVRSNKIEAVQLGAFNIGIATQGFPEEVYVYDNAVNKCNTGITLATGNPVKGGYFYNNNITDGLNGFNIQTTFEAQTGGKTSPQVSKNYLYNNTINVTGNAIYFYGNQAKTLEYYSYYELVMEGNTILGTPSFAFNNQFNFPASGTTQVKVSFKANNISNAPINNLQGNKTSSSGVAEINVLDYYDIKKRDVFNTANTSSGLYYKVLTISLGVGERFAGELLLFDNRQIVDLAKVQILLREYIPFLTMQNVSSGTNTLNKDNIYLIQFPTVANVTKYELWVYSSANARNYSIVPYNTFIGSTIDNSRITIHQGEAGVSSLPSDSGITQINPTYKSYNQAIAQADVSQADLVAISTADGSDEATTQDLTNAIKAYINANVVPLVNAIKASQNTELTNQRTAGQQAP